MFIDCRRLAEWVVGGYAVGGSGGAVAGLLFIVVFFSELAQERQEGVEILLERHANALGCQCGAGVVVLVVISVVGFQTECARLREEVFDVEVADKLVVV